MERRLTAILAADVVGYARLMARDEEGTFERLSQHRALIDAQVATHNGRVFGSAGDSVIAEFTSPVEAVRCALSIQKELSTRNATLSEDKQMLHRIGVHLGDVIAEDGNLVGDGVNISARLEALAPPGGICISKAIADQVAGKLDVEFATSGIHNLKNIETPVEVWTWPADQAKRLNGNPASQTANGLQPKTMGAAAIVVLGLLAGWYFWPAEFGPSDQGDAPRIAVLPFDDFSTGEDKGYLSDGVAEGLLTELSRYRELSVIARNSSFQFRDRGLGIEAIADELRADYVVEGSKQKTGDRIRVTVQLIDGHNGAHIWAEKYDADVGEFFEVQSSIVQEMTNRIGYELTRAPPRRSDRAAVSALHYYLIGRSEFRKKELSATLRAREYFEKAIEADPEAPYGYVGMTLALWRDLWQNDVDPETPRDEKLKQAAGFADTALKLDPEYHYAHMVRADVHVAAGELEQALLRYNAAAELNPNDVAVMAASSDALVFLGQGEEAIARLEKAIDLNPITPDWYFWQLGWASWSVGKCEAGLEAMQRMSVTAPNAQRVIAVLHVCNGNIDAARDAIAAFRDVKPDRTLRDEFEAFGTSWRDPATMQRWLDALRLAGLPE